MEFPRKILLAMDDPGEAGPAGRVAVDLAEGGGAALYLLHVARAIPPHVYAEVRPDLYQDLYEQEVEELLFEMAGCVEEAGGRVAGAYLRVGPTVEEILGFGEEVGAGMLVLGSRNLGPFGRLLLGSVSEGVIRSSRIPVLVARGVGQRWPPEQVVVWDGGSDGAKTARALASRLGDLFGTTSLVLPARPEPAVRSAAKTEVRGSPPTETRLVAGDPVEAILDAVRERERSLVIVGDPGPGTTRRARTGDVPISVLRAYGGPLLICPTRPGVEGEKGEVAPMIRRNERVPTNGTGR